MKKSEHYTTDRQEREELIKQIGYGKLVKAFVVDRGHAKGPEIHVISDTGIIHIYNKRSKKLVARLIARPGQITRYFKDESEIPGELLEIATEHQRLGYNK